MKKIVRRSLWGILAAVLILDTPLIWSPGEDGTAEAASKSVSISRKKATVNKGFTYKLKLSNVPKGSKVAWSSSNKAVASVKASGSSCVVTGKKTGRTTITAKVGSKKYTCKVTVKAQTALSETSKSLAKGKTFTLTLKNTVPGTIKWTCSSNQVVKITKKSRNQYQVKALKAGTAYVVARLDGKAYKCRVTVKNPVPALSRTSGSVTYGKTGTVTLNNAAKTVKWSVGDSSILKISASGSKKQKCTVKGLKAGKTTLKAVSNGKTYKCTITVKAASNPVISRTVLSLTEGKSATLKITKNVNKVTWKSSNKNVAVVSTKGKVTAKGAGTAKITASVDGVTRTCKVTVKAKKPASGDYDALKFLENGDAKKSVEAGDVFSIRVNNKIKSVSISPENIVAQSDGGYDTWRSFTAQEPGKAKIVITDIYNQKVTAQVTVTQELYLRDYTKVTLTGVRSNSSLPVPEIESIYHSDSYIGVICPGTFGESDPYYGYEAYLSTSKDFDSAIQITTEDTQWNHLGYAQLSYFYAYPGRSYYLKVRSYTVDGTVKVCGPWSTVRRVQMSDPSVKSSKKAEYSYDLFFLDSTGTDLYDGSIRALYIKTDNPDSSSIGVVSGGKSVLANIQLMSGVQYYDDIHYLKTSDYDQPLKKVDGGYVGYLRFAKPGKYDIEIREYGEDGYVTAKKTTWTVQDYEKAMYAWVDGIIAAHTTASMTPFQKMAAVCNYLTTPGLFKYVTQSNGKNVILASMPNNPCFVTYRWDSATSPSMLCVFAERIGGFDDIHNCYGDYPVGSSDWSNTHYLARLTIGDDVRYYGVCPLSPTGEIGDVKYIDFSNTAAMTAAD
ncbi:MAG TPA: Ig-like domain-containing protein [Candidatus Limivivens intestinipullorum]|uniref:Ig-like domain-containing protein n=1 Tax=Candidatus Limivivens intestinipullorum TaxID=2840858 RepID=A0A9D1ETM1_9FIRM|nr:Ig-like domain-containing protein [Candidatus Limivivens intestinipullorum]